MIVTVTLNPCIDRLLYVTRLELHDTNRILRVEEDAGGKGVNVARVLQRLDVPVVATGFLGGRAGHYVESVLTREGVNCDFVALRGNTRVNLAIQNEDGSSPTTLNEKGPTVGTRQLKALTRKVEEHAAGARYVALGGSLPPGIAEDFYTVLIEAANAQGARVVLDADGAVLQKGLKGRPFMIKPNECEAERLLGRTIDTLDEAAVAARELHNSGIPVVIVSMGSKGAAVADGSGAFVAVAPRIKPVSTVGSGDSTIAGFLSVLCRGGGIDEALRWGAAAGAATAMTDGSDIGNAAQIHELVPLVQVTPAPKC